MEKHNIINSYVNIEELKNIYTKVWLDTSCDFPKLEREYSYIEKIKAEKKLNKFIKTFFDEIKKFPNNKENIKRWRENAKHIFEEFFLDSFSNSLEENKFLYNQGFLKTTEDFIKEVEDFDKDINIQDIFTAIRNVWIVNYIQILLNKKVEITKAIFSYSMLYPYTDNYLDRIDIKKEEKINFNKLIKSKLSGNYGQPINKIYENIFLLIDNIEVQFKREKYKNLYKSLLSIQIAQEKSLSQQKHRSLLKEKQILAISMEKGGASVLADGYLVQGALKKEEEIFLFGLGVVLQLCDDIQDVIDDLKNTHTTLISKIAYNWPLDKVTNNIINLTLYISNNISKLKCKNSNILEQVLRVKCIHFILFAIVKNKNLYTKEYIKEIEKNLPYRISYIKKLNNKINREYKRAYKNLGKENFKKALINILG